MTVYDPKVPADEIRKDVLGDEKNDHLSVVESAYAASEGAHAIAILTEWDEFNDLDFEKIYGSMSKPAFIFDGRNILDHAKLVDIGFHVSGIGR